MSRMIPALAAATALLLTPPVLPAPVQGQSTPVGVSGTLKVDGNSTVRSWSCEAPVDRIRVVPGSGLTLATLGRAVQELEVVVDTRSMDCNNGTMDGHMWRALKSDAHPEIRFRMTGYRVTESSAGAGVLMDGELEIAGQRQPVTVAASVEEGPGGTLAVKGSHEVVMTTFGIEPPRLMMGALRVHDPVQVVFDLVLEAGAAPSSAGNR